MRKKDRPPVGAARSALVRADAITHLNMYESQLRASELGSDEVAVLADTADGGHEAPPLPEDFHLTLLFAVSEARRSARKATDDAARRGGGRYGDDSRRADAESPVSAAVSITPRSRPRVSTTACRLRPLISLRPWKPRLSVPTTASALTDWESITPVLGSGFRPACSRTLRRRRSWNSRIRPWLRQRRKNA